MSTAAITLVHTVACHYCDDAEEGLAQLRRDFDFDVELVPADSDAGRGLIAVHRPAMFPLVLADGEYLSAGRLPRGKLRAWLSTRAVAVSRS
jgi:hypothetical protein